VYALYFKAMQPFYFDLLQLYLSCLAAQKDYTLEDIIVFRQVINQLRIFEDHITLSSSPTDPPMRRPMNPLNQSKNCAAQMYIHGGFMDLQQFIGLLNKTNSLNYKTQVQQWSQFNSSPLYPNN
jgi:hypothetical protein